MERWPHILHGQGSPQRYYHDLYHLEHLAGVLNQVKPYIQNWNAAVFAIAYHDIVYSVIRDGNEEKSAAQAVARLSAFADPPTVERCKVLVLATKAHAATGDGNIDYFTDADLSILGAAPQVYHDYAGNIRKEYGLYPNPVYQAGRKKVVRHFLDMPQIFKPGWFHDRYETDARHNLESEWKIL